MNFKGKLIEQLRKVRSSYWFIPGVMTLLAILMSQAAINFDEGLEGGWLGQWDFLYDNKPEGARALLSTIAGSMIGVAGVTFSITIAAVAYASSQFGPRIIDNFMDDRGNKITLGTFISTFIYCLLVLRTVRNGEDGPGFVPHVSVFIGVVFAVASLAVFIYFIHHIPQSIHVTKLVAKIGHQFIGRIDSVYPDTLGEEVEEVAVDTGHIDLSKASLVVRSTREGHVQSYDVEGLLEFAAERRLLLVMLAEPGDFVAYSQLLARIYGDGPVEEDEIREYFVIGNERSPTQDLFFLSDQLIDITGRALSPGVNDPQTAMLCVDWLTAALARLACRRFPSRFRSSQDGSPLMVSREQNFETFVDSFYDQVRPYVEKDRNAALHMLRRSAALMECIHPLHRRSVHLASQRLVEGCLKHFDHPRDLEQLSLLQTELAQANTADTGLRAANRTSTGGCRSDPRADGGGLST